MLTADAATAVELGGGFGTPLMRRGAGRPGSAGACAPESMIPVSGSLKSSVASGARRMMLVRVSSLRGSANAGMGPVGVRRIMLVGRLACSSSDSTESSANSCRPRSDSGGVSEGSGLDSMEQP